MASAKLPPIGLALVEKRINELACQLNELHPDDPRRLKLVDEMERLVEISVDLKMKTVDTVIGFRTCK